MEHSRLDKSGTRPSKTLKWGILFWYVTMLLKKNCQWRILKTCSDEEGLVQSVQLVIGRTNSTYKETSIFDRPISKLVLLVKKEL